MLQNILNLAKAAMALIAAPKRRAARDWRCDPLSHPALRGMGARELGDLPIGHPLTAGNCECG